MSVQATMHTPTETTVVRFDNHEPAFVTVTINDDTKLNHISIFFKTIDDVAKFANDLLAQAYTLTVDE